MGKVKVNFKTFQLIIDNKMPNLQDFEKVCQERDEIFKDQPFLFQVQTKLTDDNNYFILSAKYENETLYSNMVYNVKVEQNQKNPKSPDQIELKKQVFVCYNLENDILYISNLNKKTFVENYFTSRLKKKVRIKNIYTSIDEFSKKIKALKEVKFIMKKDLINHEERIYKEENIYGLDYAEKAYLTVGFGKKSVKELPKKFLENLFGKSKYNTKSREIEAIGFDDNDVTQIFNSESVMEEIGISVDKEKNGLINPEEVWKQLFYKLEQKDKNV